MIILVVLGSGGWQSSRPNTKRKGAGMTGAY